MKNTQEKKKKIKLKKTKEKKISDLLNNSLHLQTSRVIKF